MKKILIITVVPNSSIDRLAIPVKRYNQHLDIQILPFHAKRFSPGDLKIVEEMAKGADLIDFAYWRGAEVLLREIPWLKDKKKILTHHNPYDLGKIDPNLFDKVVVKNETQMAEMQANGYEPELIRHGIDINFFKYNDDYTGNDDKKKTTIGMVAFRIEGKKGIREVAEVCNKLGYRFLLVGHISKPDYFKQIVDVSGDYFDFRQDITDEELRDAYKEMDILVVNSVDGFESGSMPILEAMSMGVPVLTRNIGLVPDINNMENMVVRRGEQEDKEDLEESLKTMIDSVDGRNKLRSRAWDSLRDYSEYRMAKEFALLYNKVLFPSKPLVSVITTTYNRTEQIVEIAKRLNEQTYKNIELVVCDDNSTDGTESAIKQMREKVDFPIKYLNTETDGYNLAMARNMGVIEADGDYVMILDSRLLPEKDAIEQFVKIIGTQHKLWLFGDKGAGKKSFVENFSMIRRKELIDYGGFNERINLYGGMSQELRKRFKIHEFNLLFLPKAKAKEMIRGSKKNSEKKMEILAMKDRLWKMGT